MILFYFFYFSIKYLIKDYNMVSHTQYCPNIYLPCEIIDIIADFHDYDKYCKPAHSVSIKPVLDNINDLHNNLGLADNKNISPFIAKLIFGQSTPDWNINQHYDFIHDDMEDDIHFLNFVLSLSAA